MSQATLIPSSPVPLPPITYQSKPVLTTEMLAEAYGCSAKNIRDNFGNNRDRFVEGKHFFSITKGELKSFRDCTEIFGAVVPPRTRILTLWTERGAARHAKMLSTDTAWDVFELLEETFFRVVRPEPDPVLPDPTTCQISKSVKFTPSTTADRAPLRSIVNAWARVSAAPVTPPAAPSVPAVPQPILSAELDRYAAEFEAIAHHIEQLSGLLQRVERVASPLVSDACRRLAGADRVRQAHLDAGLTDMLDGSRRMAEELVPRARLGINVMRDLAQARGR